MIRSKPLKRTAFHVRDKGTKGLVRRAMSRTPKSDRAKAMKAADDAFSRYIRLRDSDENGRAKCITCSHTDYWKYLQNGHFVTRGHQSTRYNERNCNAQCRGCNYNGGQHLKHFAAIDIKFGEGTAARMHERGGMECRRSAADFWAIAKLYSEKVEHIRITSPGKFAKP